MTDLVTELLVALELALPVDRNWPALQRQLVRVEEAMADAVDAVFDPDDEPLQAVA